MCLYWGDIGGNKNSDELLYTFLDATSSGRSPAFPSQIKHELKQAGLEYQAASANKNEMVVIIGIKTADCNAKALMSEPGKTCRTTNGNGILDVDCRNFSYASLDFSYDLLKILQTNSLST